jgi:hypothetical protein
LTVDFDGVGPPVVTRIVGKPAGSVSWAGEARGSARVAGFGEVGVLHEP